VESRHLVDPELAHLLTQMPAFDMNAATLAMVRAMQFPMQAQPTGAVAVAVDREERKLPGINGAPNVRVLIYAPRAAARPAPAVLHIHGGGFLIGQPEMNDARNRLLAHDMGCIVMSVDYRLAPETPFPGGIEDCYAALVWLHQRAGDMGIDPKRIAIVGESAGGGLAASLALLARDRDEVPVCFQQLIFPMLDDRTGSVGADHPYAGEFLWRPASNRFAWQSLLNAAPGGSDVSPYAAAARAENLAGLPPTFIAVGALDLFIEEDINYARRLLRAGVPTELHVYPGAFHGYQMAPQARVARQADQDAAAAIRRALERS
jgi:acetyl esterase/lipase